MDKFVIIDGNNLMFRAFYALPQLANFDGEISNAVFGFTNMLVKIIKEVKPKYIAVTFDASKKNFRHDSYPEYKGTRKPTPNELRSQFPIIKDLLNAMNIKVIEKEGLEADDLMGCLSRTYDTENIIVSADRDAFQLINETTSIMFPKKGVSETIFLNNDNLKEHYGVDASQVVDLKSLMGDTSDNIPGVPGIGEKTALDLIQNFNSLDGVYKNLDKVKPRVHDKLIEYKEEAYLSKYLCTIVTDIKLGYDLNEFEYDFPFNESVRNIFKKYQFNILIKKDELFDNSKEVVAIEEEIINCDNAEKLNDLITSIDSTKEFAIYLEGENFNLYSNKEYKICFGTDLFSSGLDIIDVMNRLKPYFEDNSIKKIIFDSKDMMHKLHKYNIAIKNCCFDLVIARYLINSIAKPVVNLSDVMVECGVSGNAYAKSIMIIKDMYYAKLEKMDLLSLYYDVEMPLVEVLFDMEISGFKVDSNSLKELEKKYFQEIKELEELIYATAGCKFNISSPKQLGEVLFDKLELNTSSNKKKSTSIDVLNEIVDKHPIVPMIIRYRTITKLYSTYIIGFENLKTQDDKIHSIFNQTLTSTGRLSSSEPNLQNIPVRTEEGRNLRKVFVPSNSNGYLLSADYSQIELRLLANFSEDEILIDAFNSGQDIHARTASEIFNVDISEVDANLRRSAKAINFGIVYGISDFGLSQNIGISRKEANNYIAKYFEKYPKIENYMKSNVSFCRENGLIKTFMGRIRPVPEISSTNYNLRLFGERVAMNMPLQGSASDIIKLAMIKIYNKIKEENLQSKLILQVHDELIFDVHPGELEKLKEIVKAGMEEVVDLKVKLIVNIEYGKTLYDAK